MGGIFIIRCNSLDFTGQASLAQWREGPKSAAEHIKSQKSTSTGDFPDVIKTPLLGEVKALGEVLKSEGYYSMTPTSTWGSDSIFYAGILFVVVILSDLVPHLLFCLISST